MESSAEPPSPEKVSISLPPATYGADADLDLQIAKLESQLRNYQARRKNINILFAIVGGLVILLGVFAKQLLQGTALDKFSANAPLFGFGMGAYLLLLAGMGALLGRSRASSLNLELDELRAKKRILHRLPLDMGEPTQPPSYFDRLVNINVSNLEAYYGLVKVHTNNSFQVSLAAGGIGFILIVTGLIFGFSGIGHAQSIAYISAGSGVVTEFIAGVFFYLYNRTVRQLKEYHDSLLAVQNILLSFKIVEDTRDENRKNIMMENMINRLVGQKATGGESVADTKISKQKARA